MLNSIAIILRGPPTAGKTTVATQLAFRLRPAKSQHILLDSGWVGTEPRMRGDNRYGDLRNPAPYLIVELGFGEPEDERFEGATRNSQEWIRILESEQRYIHFFLLRIKAEEAKRRYLKRKKSFEEVPHARYEPGGVCIDGFARQLGKYSETVIDNYCIETTVQRILAQCNGLHRGKISLSLP